MFVSCFLARINKTAPYMSIWQLGNEADFFAVCCNPANVKLQAIKIDTDM